MSVLYVDSLQPNLGSQVDIPDLKPKAGEVLQVVTNVETTTITNSSTSVMTALSTSITPKSANSKLIVSVEAFLRMTQMSGGAWALADFNIADSYTGVEVPSSYYETGVTATEARWDVTRCGIVDSVSTASRTFYIQFRMHGGIYAGTVNAGIRSMTIMEIAQ